MARFLDRLMGKSGEDDYVEVDLGQFEEVEGDAPTIVLRVAELTRPEVLPDIKKEIYAGSILLLDISPMKREKAALDRAIGELRKCVEDVSGDIVGIGDDFVVTVPQGIKIDREKVVGGKD
ncbi:MAG: cell division protein SepF [Methanosarcinales archaeon]|nr:cell division protein SepF [Methanosarcinales archaeon]